MKKEDLIRKIYLRLLDETYISDVVEEDEFVDVVARALYDYALIPEAYIIQ